MILHLFHDDKVCNHVIANFEEVYPEGNVFVCICDKENLRYIKKSDKVIFLNRGEYDISHPMFAKVDKILIHYLDVDKIHFIEKHYPLNTKVDIYWSLWGGDMYNEVLYSMGYKIYDEENYAYPLRYRMFNFLRGVFGKSSYREEVDKLIFFIENRIDYIMTFQAEFDLILEKWKSNRFRPKCIPNLPIYYPIENVLGDLFDKKVTGKNIMIGNSASFSNNHIYACKYLSGINTSGLKKIMPLSYGGSDKYKNNIKNTCYRFWGEDYLPLENFMPLKDYNELMLSCSNYIYGNWRQEAVGNIVIALYLGAKVYVSERSPLLRIFEDFGIKLYKTEQISSLDFYEAEDDLTICQNRQKILNIYSKEAILNHIKTIFDK